MNEGATCYLNSILQSLFHIPAFRRLIYEMDSVLPDKPDSQNICLQLQRLFGLMQMSGRPCSTLDLMKSFGWGDMHHMMPQDVQEFLRKLVDNLESKMRGTALEPELPRLFRGRSRSFFRCKNLPFESSSDDVFYDLSLVVNASSSLEESFGRYLQPEVLEGANQWDTGAYGRQDALVGVEFLEFPRVLHIHLRRFEFDVATRRMAKVNTYLSYPTVLDVRRYLSPPPDGACAYELFGVLVHSGTSAAGHYFAYLRTGGGRWHQFNDSSVREVAACDAVDANFGGPDAAPRPYCAYMLIYIRQDEQDDLCSPVTDAEVPAHVAAFVARARERTAQAEESRREQEMTVAATLVTAEALEGNLARLRFTVVPRGSRCTEFAFRRGWSCRQVYDAAAEQLRMTVDAFALYPIDGDALALPLPCGADTYDGGRAHFFVYAVTDGDRLGGHGHVSDALRARMLVFVVAYAAGDAAPLRFVEAVHVSRLERIAAIFGRFADACGVDAHADFPVFVAREREVAPRSAAALFIREKCTNGLFVVVQIAAGISARLGEPAALSDTADEEEDEEEDRPVVYAPPATAQDFATFMDDRYRTFQVTVTQIAPVVKKLVKLPRSISAHAFTDFIGGLLDQRYRVETHSVVFFLEHSKAPLVFDSDSAYRAMAAHAPPDAEIQLHAVVDTTLDLTILAQLYCIHIDIFWTIAMDSAPTQLLLPRSSTVQDLIDAMELFFRGRGPIRFASVRGAIVHAVLDPLTPLTSGDVSNPVRCELIPEDQREMDPEDVLTTVAIVQQEYESVPLSLAPIRSILFRLVRNEPFARTRERILSQTAFSGGERAPAFYLSSKDDGARMLGEPIPDEAVLRESATEATMIRVVIPVAVQGRAMPLDSVKLYN
jgi:hypothetical protein